LSRAAAARAVPCFRREIGVFDRDETDTPQKGIYVVYLFAEDHLHMEAIMSKRGGPVALSAIPDDIRPPSLRGDQW